MVAEKLCMIFSNKLQDISLLCYAEHDFFPSTKFSIFLAEGICPISFGKFPILLDSFWSNDIEKFANPYCRLAEVPFF